MKRNRLLYRIKRINQSNSLPTIFNNNASQRNIESSINNVSSTTNASILNSNINNSTLMSNKNTKLLKKLNLKRKFNSQRAINKSEINITNTKKTTLRILQNADKIMKERLKFQGLGAPGGRQLLKSVALNISKEACYKNYLISLLKERRTKINEKEYIISKAFEDYNEQFDKDYKNFANFIEEFKYKQRKEEDTLIELRQVREKKEDLYEEEKIKSKKLYENLERKVREVYILKKYGSFIHKIFETNFIYENTPEINSRDRNFELIADMMIDIYENKDKNNGSPRELDDINLFMKKYMQLEEEILANVSNKEIIDKDKERIKKNNKNELEQLQLSKEDYESDLNYLKNEIKNVKIEMKNYKIHEDENFEKYLYYIVDLGKEIGANCEIPQIIDKRYLTDLVVISKKTLEKLADIEEEINNNILRIENILNNGHQKDVELMEKLIVKRKNINKSNKQLEIQEMHQKMKIKRNIQIIERAKKIVVTGRKIFYVNQIVKNRNNAKQIIKNYSDDNRFEYQYSSEDVV